MKPETLEKYPLPWREGWRHETMAEIVDANAKTVCRITCPGQYVNSDAGDVVDAIIEMANKHLSEKQA